MILTQVFDREVPLFRSMNDKTAVVASD